MNANNLNNSHERIVRKENDIKNIQRYIIIFLISFLILRNINSVPYIFQIFGLLFILANILTIINPNSAFKIIGNTPINFLSKIFDYISKTSLGILFFSVFTPIAMVKKSLKKTTLNKEGWVNVEEKAINFKEGF
tara:strand:+ start:433 stop:837 length:405 start_codon:yes stop_codon:yes gene_type:complete